MSVPRSANDFIEQQLNDRAGTLSAECSADVLAFSGDLVYPVDQVVRDVVEAMRRDDATRNRLSVVLTTNGGYIEVVKRIVDTLRHHYEVVDFIVPDAAYSAGTVLAMSGDAIYMNYFSRLGPIDPQVETQLSGRQVSALGYLVQYERLIDKARDGTLSAPEAHLLVTGFDQAELYNIEQARELSVSLLKQWLVKYKFKNWHTTDARELTVTLAMKEQRAEDIARTLNDPDRWHSHGYGISMEELRRDLNLLIDDFDHRAALGTAVKDYHLLLDDYMIKRGNVGALHAVGQYVPFASVA